MWARTLKGVTVQIPTSVPPKIPGARSLAVRQKDLGFCHTLPASHLWKTSVANAAGWKRWIIFLSVVFLMTCLPQLFSTSWIMFYCLYHKSIRLSLRAEACAGCRKALFYTVGEGIQGSLVQWHQTKGAEMQNQSKEVKMNLSHRAMWMPWQP